MRFKSVVFGFLIGCATAATLVGYYSWQRLSSAANDEAARDRESQRLMAEAREKLPFQSLEERIPKRKGIPLPGPFSPVAAKRWDDAENDIENAYRRRSDLLKALHENTRKFFVKSPGAGSSRMMPDERVLFDDYWSPAGDGTQPGPAADFSLSPGDMVVRVEPNDDHWLYHEGHVFGFLYPSGFGYIKDRQHVAGFKPHGLVGVRDPVYKPWKVDHILLVGLVMHEQPVVYLSDKVPSMELLRTGKTRDLDLFEEAGLEALKSGEDLYIVQKEYTLRMFGALRATKQCLECHDAKRGDLLGAFSYTLRPKPVKPSVP